MPPRAVRAPQFDSRRGGARGDRARASREQGFFDRPDGRSVEGEQDFLTRLSYIPGTNEALRIDSEIATESGYDDQLALTANKVSIQSKSIEINIDKTAPVVRAESLSREELPGRLELAEHSYETTKVGEGLTVDGQFPLEIVSALLIKDKDNGYQMVAFRRPEIETLKGEVGASGPIQNLPGREGLSEVNEEHVILGKNKRSGEEILLSVAPQESSTFGLRSRLAKERAAQGLQGSAERITVGKAGSKDESVGSIAKKLTELQKYRKLVFTKPKALPEELDNALQTIKTKFNGETETIKGLLRFDERSKTFVVVQPIVIDPIKEGIEITDIYDGSGKNRERRMVRAADRRLLPELQTILSAANRPTVVQKDDKSLIPPSHIEARQYRSQFALPRALWD